MTNRFSTLSAAVPRRGYRWAVPATFLVLAFNAHADSARGDRPDLRAGQDGFLESSVAMEREQAGLADRVTHLRDEEDRLQERLAVLLAQASQEDSALSGRKIAQADPAPNNRGVVQLLNQVEALNGELSRLRGQMEVLSNDIANAQKRQRDMYVDLDTRLRRIEQGGAAKKDQEALSALEERVRKLEQGTATPATIPPPVTSSSTAPVVSPPPPATANSTAPATAAVVPAAAAATPATPAATPPAATSLPPATLSATDQAAIRRAYENAYSNYRLGDFPSAIRGFESFLKSYPKHELAGNAQYWIGDAYSRLHDHRSAIEAERRLLGTYPESPKAADALLVIGTSEGNMGDTAAARKTFEELIAKYPSSESAEKARQRLAKLK